MPRGVDVLEEPVAVGVAVVAEPAQRRLQSGQQLGTGNQYPLQLAAAVLMSIPVAVLFFVFQRRIMNTTEGAEKG